MQTIWIVTASWDGYTEIVGAYTTEEAADERAAEVTEIAESEYSNVSVSVEDVELLT